MNLSTLLFVWFGTLINFVTIDEKFVTHFTDKFTDKKKIGYSNYKLPSTFIGKTDCTLQIELTIYIIIGNIHLWYKF